MGKKLIDVFKWELNQIVDGAHRDFVQKLMLEGSDELITWASSSTGKYHPQDEICPEGMVIHIKRCCALAPDTARMYSLGQYGTDLLIAGSLVHDLYKRGANNDAKHTASDHMITIFKQIRVTPYIGDDLFKIDLGTICLFHEGRWTPAEAYAYGKDPYSKAVRAMHAIDMFTTRRVMWEIMLPEWSDAVKAEVSRVSNE